MGPAKKEREREFAEAGFLAAAGSSVPPHAAPGPVRGSRVLPNGMCWATAKNRRGAQNAKKVENSEFPEI